MRHNSHYVEELSARSELPVGRLLALSDIEPDPRQPRGSMGDLSELAASVREKGVLEPILVRRRRPDEDLEGSRTGLDVPYVIISGERRYRAALEAGLVEIPAIEMDVTAREALEIALIENLQRKDLTPFEEAEGFRVLAENHTYTHEQIAEAVGKSRVAITESLSLLQMPGRVRAAVQALDVTSKSVLLEVLRTGNEDEMIRLLERVASQGLNRDDIRREVQRSARQTAGKGGVRRRPYTFKFKAPDKRYSLALSFRKSTVDAEDLILALEEVLRRLRTEQEEDRKGPRARSVG
jgi:ParB family chromosome partitioning protein